jgi:hypothetical protein
MLWELGQNGILQETGRLALTTRKVVAMPTILTIESLNGQKT